MSETPLLEVRDLCKYFDIGKGQTLKAVDNVSFTIGRGEILGLVGESGCGKTTLGRVVKLLYPRTSGDILFEGKPLGWGDQEERKAYAKKAQMVFQDPYSSLDPRMTIGEIVSEGMEVHGILPSAGRRARVVELLELVGLSREHVNRFPHEFSGGQRQRIGIARALALDPVFLVCDEPISALDVSIQAQIVNLFKTLRDSLQLTYLFIAHDLSIVKYISDRIAVMYLGKIVEVTEAEKLYQEPMHPYTEFLLSAIPIPDPRLEAGRPHIAPGKEIPDPLSLRGGCSFYSRCKYAIESCKQSDMALLPIEAGHFSACTRVQKGMKICFQVK